MNKKNWDQIQAFVERGIYKDTDSVLKAALRLLVKEQMVKEAEQINKESVDRTDIMIAQLESRDNLD